MRALLWGIALACVCLLQTAADVTVQPDFDPKKFAGKWYDIGIAFQHMDTKLGSEDSHHITVEVTKEGDLNVLEQFPKENCKSMRSVLTMAGKPGKYIWEMHTIYILKTDYENYAFIRYDVVGETFLLLFGRKQEVLGDVKEAFRKLAVSMNSPLYNIIYFRKAGPCPI